MSLSTNPVPRILVVEDEPIIAADLRTRLGLLGYEVAGATASGTRALALIEETKPDLLLMDIRLAGDMDGIETAAHVFRRWHLPVIFLTAYAEEATLDRAKHAEPYGYLLKPFEDRELRTTIEITLYKHRIAEEVRRLNAELEQRVKDRTAQLEAAYREMEAFSSAVSHDLRTPLRHIVRFAEMLTEEYGSQFTADARSLLANICGRANFMEQLIEDLLDFSRLGRCPMKAGRIDMTAQARAAFEDAVALEPKRSVKLRLSALPEACGDASMVRQVWANLLSNAVKYTRPRDTAEIEVGARYDDGVAIYFVRDNGVGFDRKYTNRLFGMFQRLHSAREFEGTGAGLALVQRVIHRHGGQIWADSQIDRGTTVSFTLSGSATSSK